MKYLDSLNDFERKVLVFAKKIPEEKIVTYQSLAWAIKKPKAYRAVGNALSKNPFLIKIPCHRVIKSNGEVGGYRLGQKKKLLLLKKEGINFNQNNKITNFKNFLFKVNN